MKELRDKIGFAGAVTSQPHMLVITCPIRPIPTEYPPIGSLSVISSLKRAGFNNIHFYDIDALRPSYEEALQEIRERSPDVLGISAVVSTAYGFVKRLSLDIKRFLPDTTIILGGNLGASAEILLKKTGVDFVVTGEGEITAINFLERYTQAKEKRDFEDISGLMYLDRGKLVNTGFEKPVPKGEVYDIDWTILESESSKTDIFYPRMTPELLAESPFANDPRAREGHRKNKRLGTLVASKGCVARCTFCHRWDKSIRYIPVPILMERLREVIELHDVGFVDWGDENFGTWKNWLKEFCSAIRTFDILWRVSGMRVNSVSREALEMMKDAGCSAVYFGMETGSPRMLEIMEKKTKQEQNERALKWIHETGLHTTMQLVLGMPGENWSTIKETGDFVEFGMSLSENRQPFDTSINYAQALPGTPLYEYARHEGIVPRETEGEEKYLLSISDRDASDEETTLSLTGLPRLITEQWRPYLVLRGARGYIKKFGHSAFLDKLKMTRYFSSADYIEKREVDISGTTETIRDAWVPMELKNGKLPGIWAIICSKKFEVLLVRYPLLFWRLRIFLPLMVLGFSTYRNGVKYSVKMIVEYFAYRLKQLRQKKSGWRFPYQSLRKTVSEDIGWFDDKVEDPMIALRKGR